MTAISTPETKDGAYIVVAQRDQYILKDIEDRIYSDSPNHVFCTTNPDLALKEVVDNAVDMVVTGQIFSGPGIKDGDSLAGEIYGVKPDVLTLRYSITPSWVRREVIGDIPKIPSENHQTLVDLLNSPDLGEILGERDWLRLRETFPYIRFHDSLERLHQ
ncbi:MAG TPA: hypothetical protein ENH99_01915 [Candidatus Pacearchaeota archaeon]|nr:hypothetical protein [Candidatus Pacearchaeota archaeon]